MAFHIIRNDITKVKADAIVNTANPEPLVGGGVDFAIYEAAGREKLLRARREVGALKPGEVAVTEAFDLDAKYIIHVSGPKWLGGGKGEEGCLKSCYENALQLAEERGCQSIAFPLLSTGTYGFPKETGLQVAVDAFTSFLKESEMEITLVVFGEEAVKLSGQLVEEVRSFVDESYEKLTLKSEYRRESSFLMACRERFFSTKVILDKNLSACPEEEVEAFPPIKSLESLLENVNNTSFEKHLQQLIKKKGFKNSEVYAAANLSKQYFSKLLKGQVKPSKEKVLALALGLQLNRDEAVDFLRIAGYALSPISRTDIIVEYFISRKDYNVIKLDIVLFDYGLAPLSGS